MVQHYIDCPINRDYAFCTCDMAGEQIALVEWQIEKQEGKLHWYNFIALLSIIGAPVIRKRNRELKDLVPDYTELLPFFK